VVARATDLPKDGGSNGKHPLKLIAGNANPDLAAAIAKKLGRTLTPATVERFADGEVQVKIHESVRGAHCVIIQGTSAPVNDHLMELLVITDALQRARAFTIDAAIPYFGYGRQDKKLEPREPITARLVANMIECAGVNQVMALGLHNPSVQGFFNIPVDGLTAIKLIAVQIRKDGWAKEDCVVVAPDVGGAKTAEDLAEKMGLPLAVNLKRRPMPGKSKVSRVIGDVAGRRCILVDDMIDGAGSIEAGSEKLFDEGAKAVRAYATHGVFSGPAVERIVRSRIELVTVTNSIPQSPKTSVSKIRYISVANLFAEVIRRNWMGLSISPLFKWD
jgi:ribose-phosphate pyrophosphokinase